MGNDEESWSLEDRKSKVERRLSVRRDLPDRRLLAKTVDEENRVRGRRKSWEQRKAIDRRDEGEEGEEEAIDDFFS